MHCALTIAGSDSSAGAGIQADLKTFAGLGIYGVCAVTAITAQNSERVAQVTPVSAAVVGAQIDAVAPDFKPAATKIGMLATGLIVEAVAKAIERHGLLNVVLDPVLASSTGRELLDRSGIGLLRRRLLPLADVITPNTLEAATLTGLPVRTLADARRAALRLRELGARAIVITGGHLDGDPVDLVYSNDVFAEVGGERLASRATHGTGC
jgi:hydroxymethylpyrimidine/phosphomethylpyrimidine kinase